MAIIDLNDLLDDVHYVYNSLKEVVAQVTKKLQLKVDSEAEDPDADNSNLPFTLPYQYYATHYTAFPAKTVTHDYDHYTRGEHKTAFAYQLTLNDNVLTMSGLTAIGMVEGSGWHVLSPEQREASYNQMKSYYEGQTINIISNYPDIATLFSHTSGYFQFFPTGKQYSDIYYKYQTLTGDTVSGGIATAMYSADYTPYIDDSTGYLYNSGSFNQLSSGQTSYIQRQPFEGVFGNLASARAWVNANAATHNYEQSYLVYGGSMTVLYGDNYIIYVVPSGVKVTYNLMKNITQNIATTINSDNPDIPVIKVPTYEENKYGPEPEPTDLVSDNQEDGGNYNHAEFTKVYACTSAELENLYQWMGGGAAGSSGTSPVTVPDNFDPMNRIVGLIGYPMIIDAGVGDETTFTFRNAANQTINTGWSTYKYANFDRAFDFGTVDIPNWEEVSNGAPFLDYSATVEIYIPFCGVVGLDPQAVMGCTLSCKMWIDFLTGDCSAVVYTNYGGEDAQHPVAFVSGNCGSAEVVSANAFGAYQGAKAQASHKMSQAILGGFKDLATSVIGGATTGFTRGAANPSGTGGNAGMRAGAIGSVMGGAMNLGVNLTLQNLDNRYAVQVAKNALGTTISGSFGQQTSWYYMDTPYIKVTWPTPISKDVELYGKTFGVPVHRSGTLNEFTGYTVCNNVDVSGIAGATASELAVIKQFLETGVFIKEGGEE